MKVLFVSSEAYPFMKTGGLGDVTYALPKALKALGVDVRVIMPKYSTISPLYRNCMTSIKQFSVSVGWRDQYCGLQYLLYENVPYYFIDNEYYFSRPAAYGFYDEGERFSYFCRAVLESIEYMDDFIPDIIHCNDWHCGIIPVLLHDQFKNKEKYQHLKTLFTIHNLKYQGVFPKDTLGDLLNLNISYFDESKLKYYDCISFMKGALNFSNMITTVSYTYSKEVTSSFYGEGLHGLLKEKECALKGIINGIDYELFDPKTDEYIYKNYDINSLEDKIYNKLELQKKLNLPVNKEIPMIAMVTRLVNQKGLDLITGVIEELLSLPIQLVVLGTGEVQYEDLFEYYASIYPSKLSSNIRFDNCLAQQFYAASDLFLMPSLFEPCGIGQLVALRYGSIPIVRETGGLKDTIIPYNQYSGEGDGFSFANYNAHEMLFTIKKAIEMYHNKSTWYHIMKNAMMKDTSWEASARNYMDLYTSMM